MSAIQIICLCGAPLRPNGNFCARCGREVRQHCPICFDERRLIAKCDPHAPPWCDNRGELLLACKGCGRWFSADVRECPDPTCHGSVGPTWPASIGRSTDGGGHAGAWHWPARWDRQNPCYTAPRQDAWKSETPVHAAFVVHGRLYVWTGPALIAPEGAAGGPLAEVRSRDHSTPWRCWLKLDGQPNPAMSVLNRVSLVGGGAILAAQNEFLLAGLYPNRVEDVVSLDIGTPLAQVASEGWWVGWSRKSGNPTLWFAPVPANWRNLDCRHIPGAPPQSAPRENTPLILRDGIAYWVGEDGVPWRLDIRSRDLQPMKDEFSGIQRVWCESDGLHTVRITGDGIRVGLDAVVPGGIMHEALAGVGPLRDIFAAAGMVAVVGETVTTRDAQSAQFIESGRYSGQWVAGALAHAQPDAADREPCLLMLTYDRGNGNLSALRPSSGGEEAVWSEAGVRPLSLIVAGESLYVVHERGVTRIQEALP